MKFSALVTFALLGLTPAAFAVNPVDGLPEAVKNLHQAVLPADACQDDLPMGSEEFSLGFGKKLYLVPCIMGAYQGLSRAYISQQNEGAEMTAEQLPLLSFNTDSQTVYPTLDLTGVEFDRSTNTLSTFAKSRGLGDCGVSSVSKITVELFSYEVKTVELRAKSECDEVFQETWPVVFKQ